MRIRHFTLLGVVLGAFACSTLEMGSFALVGGADDAGPFNEPACVEGGTEFCGPAPTSIQISAITLEDDEGGVGDAGGAPMVLSTEPYNGASTITLPQVSSDNIDILQATAFDQAKDPVIFGQTLPLSVGGIDGLTLDLFVQRKGQFAELPSPFSLAPASPLAAIVEGRFVLVASTASEGAELYDLLLWGLAENPDGGETGVALPCTPLSIAAVEGTTLALIICKPATPSATGDLTTYIYDVSGEFSPSAVTEPSGSLGTWRDVGGGATVVAPNGDAFIVGGTRPAITGLGATNWALKVGAATADEDGGTAPAPFVQFIEFSAPRLGATAAWSPSRGLVILGGNQAPTDGGSGAVGVEFIGEAETDASAAPTSTPLPFPLDLAVGEGSTGIGDSQILVAGGTLPDGGVPPIRLFDLALCSAACVPTVALSPDAGAPRDGGLDAAHPDASLDSGAPANGHVPLLSAQGFAEAIFRDPNPGSTTSAMFVGIQSDKLAHAYEVSSVTLTGVEVPLRAQREGAIAIQTPIPQVLVIGGSPTMESFIP